MSDINRIEDSIFYFRGSYDLHFQHFGFMATERNHSNNVVPWIPIDPSIIMPHHIKYGRIPATFQPKGK